LPADLPAAVFVVLHIPAQSVGILSTVASNAGPLPVRQAKNGMKIEPGQGADVLAKEQEGRVALRIIEAGRTGAAHCPRRKAQRPAPDAETCEARSNIANMPTRSRASC